MPSGRAPFVLENSYGLAIWLHGRQTHPDHHQAQRGTAGTGEAETAHPENGASRRIGTTTDLGVR
jgi:hypothetical protein